MEESSCTRLCRKFLPHSNSVWNCSYSTTMQVTSAATDVLFFGLSALLVALLREMSFTRKWGVFRAIYLNAHNIAFGQLLPGRSRACGGVFFYQTLPHPDMQRLQLFVQLYQASCVCRYWRFSFIFCFSDSTSYFTKGNCEVFEVIYLFLDFSAFGLVIPGR